MPEFVYYVFIVLMFVIGFVLGRKNRKKELQSDGYLNVVSGDARLVYQLEINTAPEKLQQQDKLILNVRKVAPTPVVEDIPELT